MMLRLAFHLLSVIFAIRGTISQEICCEKKTINNVEYKLTQDEVAANPSCMNGCIYQEVGNPSSYACFVDAYNEVGCSVDVQEQTILVTGGHKTETSAELISTNGSSICELPTMSQSKRSHTQSGLTACGDFGNDTVRRSCIKFEGGSWTTLTDNLVEKRYYQSSWVNSDGDILLIGGYGSPGSPTTTEIVYLNGTSIRSFDLKYETKLACSIEMPEMFILTGGFNTLTTVSRYSSSGWMEDLPELNEGRIHHGCGFFYNDDMQRVFLVAGGTDGSYNYLSSTETLVEGGQSWKVHQDLPTGRKYLRGISLLNTVIMTGGYNSDDGDNDDVLMFDPKTSDWKKIGSMKIARANHAASLVNTVDVIDYCKN